METKICSKCKKEFDISCFYKDKTRKDGFRCYCKICSERYRKKHAEQIAKQKKQYCRNNAEQIKQQLKSNAKFDLYCDRLKQFEKIRRCLEDQKLLEVKCAYCGKWMKPTTIQVRNRIRVFNGALAGEQLFYCSENCKQACSIYGQIKYPKGFKKATSREVTPLLRQFVLERDDYTCQKCGTTTKTAQLHVHHIISYAQNKMLANDPDSCITLCKNCHKFVHSQEGCRYIDLTC